jgi:hypothetical protein
MIEGQKLTVRKIEVATPREQLQILERVTAMP